MTPAQAARRRQAALILAAMAAFVSVSLVVVGVQRRTIEQGHTLSPLTAPLSRRAPQIASIVVRDRNQTLTIARTPEGFVLRERRDHPVPLERVMSFLSALDRAGVTVVFTDPAVMAPFDLDDPATGGSGVSVTITGDNNVSMFEARFGYHAATSAVFARRADQLAIFEVANAPQPPNMPAAWLDLTPASTPRETVQTVTVSPLEGPQYQLTRSDAAADFSVAAPFESLAIVAPVGVSATAHAFSNLAPSDVALASVAAMGRLLGRARIETFAGLTIDVTVTDSGDGRYWITLHAQGKTPEATRAAVGINARAARWAYQIIDLEARSLTAPLATLVRYGR